MATRLKAGDTAYLVESNRIVREVTVVRCSGGMYLIKFPDTCGGIQVKEHRLFATRELAEESIGIKKMESEPTRGYRSPYDYGI